MTDRHFRLIFGLALLVFLYLDQFNGIWILVAFLLFEGLSNRGFCRMTSRLLGLADGDDCGVRVVGEVSSVLRIPFAAERALRLVIALLIIVSVFLFQDQLWWVAWFVAFALFGAGVSGVCPLLTSLRLLGFR